MWSVRRRASTEPAWVRSPQGHSWVSRGGSTGKSGVSKIHKPAELKRLKEHTPKDWGWGSKISTEVWRQRNRTELYTWFQEDLAEKRWWERSPSWSWDAKASQCSKQLPWFLKNPSPVAVQGTGCYSAIKCQFPWCIDHKTSLTVASSGKLRWNLCLGVLFHW